MKKNTIFLACCIGLMLFASCKKGPIAPTIDIQKGEGFVYENAQVYSGDEIMVGFYCTGESLTKVEIVLSQNGTILDSYTEDCTSQKNEPVPPYHCEHNFTIEATGTVNIKGTVTDAIGHTASKSFNVLYEEKPNAKFIGHYEGDILISGTADIIISNMEPMHENLENQPFPAIIDIEEDITGIDKVVANISISGQNNLVHGIVEGNKVIFEAVNDTFTYNYQYQGFSIPIPLTMTYSINGLLSGEQLDLDGDCDGNGEINLALFNINGTFALDGIIGGSLNKLR